MGRIKNIAVVLLLVFAGMPMSFAQKVEPTSTWPYLYREFQEGVVRMNGGDLVKAALMNVSLDGKVHYVREKDQKVMSADMLRVFTARVGDDVYVNCGGRMMKVLAENENGTVVCEYSLNAEEMGKSDIGYGISSSTASTQKLSSLAGDSSSLVNLPLSTLMEGRGSGEKLPVARRVFLRLGLNMVPASRKGVTDASFVDGAAAKAFFKSKKIKWNDPSSLLEVVDFLSANNK